MTPDQEAARRATLARVAARRERHRHRPLIVRILVVAGGFVVCIAGLAFVVWLPEAGLPLLVTGLGLLALEFSWAARGQAALEWHAARARRRLAKLPRTVKITLLVLGVGAVLTALWLILL